MYIFEKGIQHSHAKHYHLATKEIPSYGKRDWDYYITAKTVRGLFKFCYMLGLSFEKIKNSNIYYRETKEQDYWELVNVKTFKFKKLQPY